MTGKNMETKHFAAPAESGKIFLRIIAVLLCSCAASAAQPDSFGKALDLRNRLTADGLHSEAALECRRNAADASSDTDRAGWLLLAADSYRMAGEWSRMDKMLDSAETADSGFKNEIPLVWLRGESAEGSRNWSSAAFYYDRLSKKTASGGHADFALRKVACAYLMDGDAAAASAVIAAAGDAFAGSADDPASALAEYRAGSGRSPWLGGVLGIIPGLGYAYSGEYGSAIRSVMLNALFIWGMTETADRDQWGAFGVLTFFELTWYSGSIYGGVDSAHRYNAERLDAAAEAIRGAARPSLEHDPSVPLLILNMKF